MLDKLKHPIIKRLSPFRRAIHNIYYFRLSSCLGKIIVELNTIDHNVVDLIFNFLIVGGVGEESVKEFYKTISSQTMGRKLKWLKLIYNGDIDKAYKDMNTKLSLYDTVDKLIGNKDMKEFIEILDKLITDTRNPLVHSNYFLGYGNEYEWKLSYERMTFNKKTNMIEHFTFSLKDAKAFLINIKNDKEKLNQLFGKILHKSMPIK